MNILTFLYLISSLSANLQDKQYSHAETYCSYVYNVTKHWDLKLKAEGSFNLKFSEIDTRYEKKRVSEYWGTWKKEADTIVLNIGSLSTEKFAIKKVKYLSSKRILTAVGGGDYRLPDTFEEGKVYIGY